MKIGYLVDSSFVIPKNNLQDEIISRIHWVEFLVIDPSLNQYEEEKITISEDALLKLFEKFPKQGLNTSATPIGKLELTLKNMLKKYDYIIGIPIAKVLSSQYNLFKSMEKREIFKGKFFIYGEENCLGQSFKEIKLIDKMLKNYSSLSSSILNECEIQIKQLIDFKVIFYVSDLTRLYLSGRINKTKFVLGKLAKIKVSLEFKKDGVKILDKGRSLYILIDKAINKIKKDLKNKIPNSKLSAHLYFFAMKNETKTKVIEITKSIIDVEEISCIPSIIAAHLGKDLVIIIISCKKDYET